MGLNQVEQYVSNLNGIQDRLVRIERVEAVGDWKKIVGDIAEVCSLALKDDPLGPLLTGGNASTIGIPYFEGVFGAAAIGGHAYVATLPAQASPADGLVEGDASSTSDERVVVGAAAWFGPGEVFLSSEEQLKNGWNEFMERADDNLRAWYTDYWYPLQEKMTVEAWGHGYHEKRWELQLFAVHPAYHRRGIGRKLVEVVDVQAKEAGVPMMVETCTEIDVLIYERLGFKLDKAIKVESYAGSTDLYFMSKAA